MNELFEIIRFGTIEQYECLIPFVDINIVNEFQQNLLHEAVTCDKIEISKDLIKRGINLSHKDEDGQTVLHYAAVHGQLIISKLIIQNRGDVNICDKHGNNALWTAVFNARGDYSIVELFINIGKGNPDNKNLNNKSCLDFARQINDEELIKRLID